MLDPLVTNAELQRFKDSGITGFRVKANGKGGLSFADTQKMVGRIDDFAWHVEFMSQSLSEAIAAMPFLNGLKLPYVLDHVAHVEPRQGQGPGDLRKLLAILENEQHAWINLYSFYQLSQSGPPDYGDMVDVVGKIIDARPDRVLWGSNWPHAGIAVPMPNDGDLLDFLLAAAPEERKRKLILADNPAKLYGWRQDDSQLI